MSEEKILERLKALEKKYDEDTEEGHMDADQFHMELIEEYLKTRGLEHLMPQIKEQSGGWYA